MSRFVITDIDYGENDALLFDTKYGEKWFFQFNRPVGEDPTLMDAYTYMITENDMSHYSDLREQTIKELAGEIENQSSKPRPTLKDLLNSTEAADIIAKESLVWHRDAIIEDIIAYEQEGKGHPEDYTNNIRYLHHFNAVCYFYGLPEKGTKT